jgi:hypothetical protein
MEAIPITNWVNAEYCKKHNKIFVQSRKRKDGKMVRSYCKNRPTEKKPADFAMDEYLDKVEKQDKLPRKKDFEKFSRKAWRRAIKSAKKMYSFKRNRGPNMHIFVRASKENCAALGKGYRKSRTITKGNNKGLVIPAHCAGKRPKPKGSRKSSRKSRTPKYKPAK